MFVVHGWEGGGRKSGGSKRITLFGSSLLNTMPRWIDLYSRHFISRLSLFMQPKMIKLDKLYPFLILVSWRAILRSFTKSQPRQGTGFLQARTGVEADRMMRFSSPEKHTKHAANSPFSIPDLCKIHIKVDQQQQHSKGPRHVEAHPLHIKSLDDTM